MTSPVRHWREFHPAETPGDRRGRWASRSACHVDCAWQVVASTIGSAVPFTHPDWSRNGPVLVPDGTPPFVELLHLLDRFVEAPLKSDESCVVPAEHRQGQRLRCRPRSPATRIGLRYLHDICTPSRIVAFVAKSLSGCSSSRIAPCKVHDVAVRAQFVVMSARVSTR